MSIRAVGPQVEEGATPAGSARVKRRKKAERRLDRPDRRLRRAVAAPLEPAVKRLASTTAGRRLYRRVTR